MARIKKSSAEFQRLWSDRILRAKAVRKKWKELFKVDALKEYFDGKQKPPEVKDEEWITINKIYSHLKAQLPALYQADPYFFVTVKKSYTPNPMDIALFEYRAKIRQAMLNYIKVAAELKEKVRLCIQDAHFSYGVAEVYHASELVDNPDFGENMTGEDGLPLLTEEGLPIAEPKQIPINERYCVSRIHPDDFLWDEDSGPLPENWRWLAKCKRMTRDQAEDDPLYTKAMLRKLEGKSGGQAMDDERKAREDRKKGGDIAGRLESMTTPESPGKKPEVFYFWHIYDLEEKKLHIIVEGGEVPLLENGDLPRGVIDHPFAILRFTLRDDSPYPIPPLAPMMPPQQEYNLARSRILMHRKRFNRKYYASGQWEPEELSKIETGDDGAIAKSATPGSTIAPIQDAPLDQMGYAEINLLNNDMIELGGGASQEARGIAGAESATQAGILDKRLELKEGDSMSMVVDFAKVIARKIDAQVEANFTRDEAVKITGPEGENWHLVRVEDYEEIQGEYQYEVNVGATIPRLPEMERAQWLAFMQVVMQFPALLTAPHFMKKMANMFHLEDDAMIEELRQLGLKVMQGMMQPPKQTGSQPGVPTHNPATVVGGQAGGPQSLMMPGAGNINAPAATA